MTNMISYFPMVFNDLHRCVELEEIIFNDDNPWSLSIFQRALSDRCARYYVALSSEVIIGYAGIVVNKDISATAEIHTIGVDPHYQGQGIGRHLLYLLLEYADQHEAETFLEVRTDNIPAINLYQSAGFVILGKRPKYYQSSGKDAYTMYRARVGNDHMIKTRVQ